MPSILATQLENLDKSDQIVSAAEKRSMLFVVLYDLDSLFVMHMVPVKRRGQQWLESLMALILASGSLTAMGQLADAQIVPDGSLGTEQSCVVRSPQGLRDRVEGGAIRGSLLFHSFSEFNVNAGQQVYFANPAAITNILTRVTGRDRSEILGTLGVEGRANLFLINPNGIVFGQNARLDVAGSFTATTADSVWLDGYEFSATNPQAPPLLTINLMPGLQYGRNAPDRTIENQGRLAVGIGQQLSLLGGTVRHSGSLVAPGGLVELSGDRVELSGTVDTRAANGIVGTFLLDPKDILIQAGTPITGTTISAALAANNVVLQADNDITVDNNIATASGNALTFLSGRSLSILPNRRITLNGGNFSARINEPVNAVDRDPGVATFSMGSGARITTNGGNVSVTSGTFGATSQINTAAASIVTSSRVNGGTIALSALGDMTTGLLDSRAAIGRGGTITLNGGTITTTQDLTTDATGQAGNVFLTATGDLNITRRITANAIGQAGNLSLIAGGNLNLTSSGFVRGGTPTFGTTGNIASVGARSGSITLTSGGTLSGQDVRVANIITGSGTGGNTIVNAQSIVLERSSLLALTNGSGRSGDIQVNAAENVTLRDSNIATNANDGTTGNAGDLTLNTQRLSILRTPGIVLPFQGAGVATTTDLGSSGNAGNLSINASESIELRGDLPGAYVIDPTQVIADLARANRTAITTVTAGSGNAGNLTIQTRRIVLQEGAGIFTFSFAGRGGDLAIQAVDIFSQGAGGISTGTLGSQPAGDLAIATDRLTLTDGALLSAGTAGNGNGGNIDLSVRQLRVLNGSAISTVTLGAGNGGATTIRNAESIEVAGTSPQGESPSGIRADSAGGGNAGRLTISTDRLSLKQGGGISVSAIETANAGDIAVDARSLSIDQGFITATSTSGAGGNLALRAADLLILRRGSTISTTAGQAMTGGNGGNITIRAGFVVAVPSENSDISANAFAGRGGNITIATQGLFGLQLGDRLTPLSDITASSEFGLDGTVRIDVLNPDPARGLVQLPITLIDSTGQIVARCSAPTNQSNSFVVTGQGGLPQDPRQFLPGQTVIQDLRSTTEDTLVETPQTISSTSLTQDSKLKTQNSNRNSETVVEAQGLHVNAQGEVELVANPQFQPPMDHLNCQTLRSGSRE